MDVTPQVINEVEFHQKMRGYDPDEVDDFLERVAAAVGQMHDRIREAAERAAIAERRAAELEARVRDVNGRPAAPAPAPAHVQAQAPVAKPTSPSDEDDAETIRRTLILAQRTADAAVKDAQDAAARTLQSAEEQAQRVLTEAQERARQLVTEAESEARKTADGTRQRLVSEIISLEEARDGLRADHGILERHLEEQRLRLRSSIGDLQRLLDDPGRLRVAPSPTLRGTTRPAFLDEELAAADDAAAAEPEPEIIDLHTPDAEPIEPPPVGSNGPRPSSLEESKPKTGGVTFSEPEDSGPMSSPSSRVAVKDREDDAWAQFADVEAAGPPTQPIDLAGGDDDIYLAELRKAMLEDTSPNGGSVHDDDSGSSRPRARFGRRR
jgi:DivIVA domain-containing protein